MFLSALVPRQLRTPLRRRLRGSRLAQIGLILAVWLLAEWLVRYTGLPLPSGIVGMAMLLGLLASRQLAPQTLMRGAEWLLAEMLLFFVPAAMILLDNRQMVGWLGAKLLVVVAVGTVLVMAVTAVTVECCLRLSQRRAR